MDSCRRISENASSSTFVVVSHLIDQNAVGAILELPIWHIEAQERVNKALHQWQHCIQPHNVLKRRI